MFKTVRRKLQKRQRDSSGGLEHGQQGVEGKSKGHSTPTDNGTGPYHYIQGTIFELLPALHDGHARRAQHRRASSPDLLATLRHSMHTDTPISVIHFDELDSVRDSDVQSHSHSQHRHTYSPPTPNASLVYTAGGRAKSLYNTVGRPGSIRRNRADSLATTNVPSVPSTPWSTHSQYHHQQKQQRSYTIPPVPPLVLPSVKKRHKQIPTFNILFAGSENAGKKSCVRLMAETLDIDRSKETNKKALENVRLPSFGADPTSSEPNTVTFTTTTLPGQRLRLSLTSFPALSFQASNSSNITADLRALDLLEYVEGKLETTMQGEEAVVRERLRFADQHVHVCLHFLTPTCFIRGYNTTPPDHGDEGAVRTTALFSSHIHGMSICPHHLDIMKQLAKRTNVIPIIARADALSLADLEAAKAAVRALTGQGAIFDPVTFSQANVKTSRSAGAELDEETPDLGESEDENARLPEPRVIRSRSNSMRCPESKIKRFSTLVERPTLDELESVFPISFFSPEWLPSEPLAEENGDTTTFRARFTRQFRYGTAQVENELHCEYTGLKRVLFTTGWKTLKDATECKYETFRTGRLQERQDRVPRMRTVTA